VSPRRVWKDNFAADCESADQLTAMFPTVRTAAVENRRFLRRAVHHLTAELGIRQFLDIGTGLPTADNTHQVAQAVAPESRVVYVDNDPMVMVHARALLTSTPEGATSYLEDDLRFPAFEGRVREPARRPGTARPGRGSAVGVAAGGRGRDPSGRRRPDPRRRRP
jgi:hypothetical protein